MATKKKDDKKQKSQKQIVDVNCYVKFIGNNGAIVEYNDDTFITSKTLLTQLIEGDLKTKEGNPSTHLKLGKKDGAEIVNVDVYLTLKGKSIYFVPDGQTVLIASLTSFEKLISGEWDHVRMGQFQ